jgi:hypothetical protein
VLTVIVGGEICGYCAIGRLKAEIVPKITMIKDITIANIGRFIKNLDNYSTP